jgi:hypothetical protein
MWEIWYFEWEYLLVTRHHSESRIRRNILYRWTRQLDVTYYLYYVKVESLDCLGACPEDQKYQRPGIQGHVDGIGEILTVAMAWIFVDWQPYAIVLGIARSPSKCQHHAVCLESYSTFISGKKGTWKSHLGPQDNVFFTYAQDGTWTVFPSEETTL